MAELREVGGPTTEVAWSGVGEGWGAKNRPAKVGGGMGMVQTQGCSKWLGFSSPGAAVQTCTGTREIRLT